MHKKYTPDILYVLDANGKEFHCGDLGYLKYPIFSSNGIFDKIDPSVYKVIKFLQWAVYLC